VKEKNGETMSPGPITQRDDKALVALCRSHERRATGIALRFVGGGVLGDLTSL
jgi:hypothetical protein